MEEKQEEEVEAEKKEVGAGEYGEGRGGRCGGEGGRYSIVAPIRKYSTPSIDIYSRPCMNK